MTILTTFHHFWLTFDQFLIYDQTNEKWVTLITDAPITDDVPYNGRFFKAPTVRYKAQGVYNEQQNNERFFKFYGGIWLCAKSLEERLHGENRGKHPFCPNMDRNPPTS